MHTHIYTHAQNPLYELGTAIKGERFCSELDKYVTSLLD